jgi:hypothetical protein
MARRCGGGVALPLRLALVLKGPEQAAPAQVSRRQHPLDRFAAAAFIRRPVHDGQKPGPCN